VQKEMTGQPFFARQKFALQKQILQIYGNLGYADVSAEISDSKGEQPSEVTLSAAITSGPRVIIDAVEIIGNTRTRSSFIRSRLQLKPGDTFSIEKKQGSFRELYRTGLFSSVDIGLKGEAVDEQRTLLVSVIEAPAKEVYVEPGWGSYERLRVKFGFREANLLGTGRIFDADTEFSVKARGAGVSVIDPWFLNTDITAELPVSYEYREEPSFTREDIGASFLLTKELSDHVTVTGGYTFKRTSLTDVDPDQFDKGQDQDYDLGSIKAQISYDTRNDIFFPTKGQKSFLSAEYADDLFGGNISFGRLAGGLRFFWQVRRGTVLAARYSTGLIIPGPDQIGVPIGERFFNGGENTVRSFEEAQLGPKDASNDPTGGLAYNTISVELRQQLVSRLVGSLFVDFGNVAPNRSREELGKSPYSSRSEIWQDTLNDYFSDFRPAVGVGLQYLLPFGPARLDVAFNPDRNKKRDEDLYAWHFSIGMAF
jgi:outer membrane protein assembly complex protein YaeT